MVLGVEHAQTTNHSLNVVSRSVEYIEVRECFTLLIWQNARPNRVIKKANSSTCHAKGVHGATLVCDKDMKRRDSVLRMPKRPVRDKGVGQREQQSVGVCRAWVSREERHRVDSVR